jgi:hypothetical protein
MESLQRRTETGASNKAGKRTQIDATASKHVLGLDFWFVDTQLAVISLDL